MMPATSKKKKSQPEPEPETQSHILAAAQQAAAQPLLFEISEEQAYEYLESATNGHEFTGERLFQQRPAVYRLVVRMIGEGLSTRQICRACAVSHHTVEAVRRREGITVAAEKEELLGIVRSGARLCAERVVELAPEMDARDASVAFGIMSEKLLLLSGEATVIVATDDKVRHADFNALVAALPRANAHEVTPQMGFSAQEPKQMCEPPAALGGLPPEPASGRPDGGPAGELATPCIDKESTAPTE
jgi:hypothetical protein